MENNVISIMVGAPTIPIINIIHTTKHKKAGNDLLITHSLFLSTNRKTDEIFPRRSNRARKFGSVVVRTVPLPNKLPVRTGGTIIISSYALLVDRTFLFLTSERASKRARGNGTNRKIYRA